MSGLFGWLLPKAGGTHSEVLFDSEWGPKMPAAQVEELPGDLFIKVVPANPSGWVTVLIREKPWPCKNERVAFAFHRSERSRDRWIVRQRKRHTRGPGGY